MELISRVTCAGSKQGARPGRFTCYFGGSEGNPTRPQLPCVCECEMGTFRVEGEREGGDPRRA